ncbi:MAG TPA: apolipoprotein N-acyltransferase [Alphaproteobacteria bacterium]|nr:apolipoprotein N-acyltransferase [Alphaproteobacteria bacterium]
MPRLTKSFLDKLRDAAAKLRALKGGKRLLAAFIFGGLTATAYAPINFFPILWISFPALIFLLQGTVNWKQAFAVGWMFAFGGFFFGLYWIADSMFVDIAQFWWAVPLALCGLPIFFALYYGAGMVLARRAGLQGITGAVTFALFWFLADYARGHVVTGFPWNLEGYTWARVLPVLQLASITGVYDVTLITVLIASLPAVLVDKNRIGKWTVAAGIVLLLAIAGWGGVRLAYAPMVSQPHVRIRLVQPNTDQAHKWDINELDTHFQELLDLSSAPAAQPITHVIWPETAATFYLAEDDRHRDMIASHIPQGGALMTGVIRRELNADNKINYYNSMVALDDHARIVAGYDKVHLVPFGEYIPMRSLLKWRTLANLGLDFSMGEGLRSLRVPGLPSFSPLICYEAIFPGEVIERDDRPHFLVNITNDGWYGHTAGPYQHFANVKVRAIEEGLPLVRAANTGVSGVVDPYGRVVARLGVGNKGFIDSSLPQNIAPTFFARMRETSLWVIYLLLALAVLVGKSRSRV